MGIKRERWGEREGEMGIKRGFLLNRYAERDSEKKRKKGGDGENGRERE